MLTRRLAGLENPLTTHFWTGLVGSAVLLPLLWASGIDVRAAFAAVPATHWALLALVGWWLFGHLPDFWGWIGMAVIAVSGATSAWLNLRGAAPRLSPVAADTIAD